MSQILSQGLEISLIGLGLTFASLGLLVLMMVLLERAFRPPPVEQDRQAELTSTTGDPDAEEIAVAVGVAITYLREQERSQAGLGATLGTGHGAYWSQGRAVRAGRPASRGFARSDRQ